MATLSKTTTTFAPVSTPAMSSRERLLQMLSGQGNNSNAFAMTTGKSKGEGIATQVFPRFELLLPGEVIAMDIEFQQYWLKVGGVGKCRLGWVGIVNSRGETILDCFVQYLWDDRVSGIHWPPEEFGVWRERTWERNGAVNSQVVEEWIRIIMKDRPVVLHGGTNDREAFFHLNPYVGATRVVDTQVLYSGHNGKAQPGLKELALDKLKLVVQNHGPTGTGHTPVEDALVTMVLYLRLHPYDRPTEYTKFQGFTVEAKAAYFASGPKIEHRQYQGNTVITQASHPRQRGDGRQVRGGQTSRGGQGARGGTVARGGQAFRGGMQNSRNDDGNRRNDLGAQRGGGGSRRGFPYRDVLIARQTTFMNTSVPPSSPRQPQHLDGSGPVRGGLSRGGRGRGHSRGGM